METNKILIIDHGTFNIKAGLVSAEHPTIMRSLGGCKRATVGRNMIIGLKPGSTISNEFYYYGLEALEKANVLRIENSIENKTELKQNAKGLYKKILDEYNLYEEGRCNVNILYLISSFVDKIFIDSVMNIFINEFNVNQLNMISQAVCAAYFFQVDGVLDIGENVSECTIVRNRNVVLNERTFLGGSHLTNYLKNCFEDGEYFKTDSIEAIRRFKENNIKIVSNEEETNSEKISLVVDDGSEYEFGKELYECSEIFFNPSIAHKEEKSIPQLLKTSFDKEKIEKLCIIGGSSKILNLSKRIKKELEFLEIEIVDKNEINIDEVNWLGAKKMYEDGVLFENGQEH
jgi:actin-related protein